MLHTLILNHIIDFVIHAQKPFKYGRRKKKFFLGIAHVRFSQSCLVVISSVKQKLGPCYDIF